MALDALRSLIDSPSIVAWFALLVMVFAVFVGLGLYAARRDSHRNAAARDEALTKNVVPTSTSRSRLRAQREFSHSQETS